MDDDKEQQLAISSSVALISLFNQNLLPTHDYKHADNVLMLEVLVFHGHFSFVKSCG